MINMYPYLLSSFSLSHYSTNIYNERLPSRNYNVIGLSWQKRLRLEPKFPTNIFMSSFSYDYTSLFISSLLYIWLAGIGVDQ